MAKTIQSTTKSATTNATTSGAKIGAKLVVKSKGKSSDNRSENKTDKGADKGVDKTTAKSTGTKSERALYRNINRELDRATKSTHRLDDIEAEESANESINTSAGFPEETSAGAPQPLSVKEKSVLEFLEVYISTQGVSPTYSEICKHFGFASFNSVQRYLKQLEVKGYIRLPWANQKRAITLLHASSTIQDAIQGGVSVKEMIGEMTGSLRNTSSPKGISKALGTSKGSAVRSSDNVISLASSTENFALPLLGRVAAGSPIEAMEHDEFIDVPASLVRYADRTYALRVQGQSMIEDGILDGDVILVQRQSSAINGEIVVAMVGEEATVKRFYMHRGGAAAAHSARAAHDFDDDVSDGSYDETQSSDRFKQGPGKKIELRPANSTMQSMWFEPSEIQIRGIVVGLIRKFF